MKRFGQYILCFLLLSIFSNVLLAGEKLPITVEENIVGAPQLLGIPFPVGKLHSVENVRVLNRSGVEIPSQITEVSTWEPTSTSIKWIWVFFFSEDGKDYTLEFGEDVKRKEYTGPRVVVENNQRPYGGVEVTTGPLRFFIDRRGGGFLDKVQLDTDNNGFDDQDIIAVSDKKRGTFMDILDDAGIDPSTAKINGTFVEKGSGPMHAIIRIEGEYLFNKSDNNPSPFTLRIHAYAGKSYIRLLHTFVYTGVPDKHVPVEGQYGALATQNKNIIDQSKLLNAPGWTEPNDRIKGLGFRLDYKMGASKKFRTGYYDGAWYNAGDEKQFSANFTKATDVSLLQTGENVNRIPPYNSSSSTQRVEGFKGTLKIDNKESIAKSRLSGWITLTDNKWGIGVAIRNFFEEYPKEIKIQGDSSSIFSYVWSPEVDPMAFPRANGLSDSELIGNFAEGMAKTTEFVYQFYKAETPDATVYNNFQYFLDPPVSHVTPSWYGESNAFGYFAARDPKFPDYERGLDYKFDWMQFNQKWEPWYGMLDYGDFQTYYVRDNWVMWNNNEPFTDYMWWQQFMRTGRKDLYLAGWATSLHTMDVDNIHWPTFPSYRGDSNEAIDYFNSADPANNKGTPYLGMGRRHAAQHFTSLLSAHVWVKGWIASYYLAGNHRGLDVAEQTGDYYLRRIFGDHGLKGRRLYLSVLNLSEIYDASKKDKYFVELKDRAERMLELQKDQDHGGSLVLERYGYSQGYISHGLYKYYQLTQDPKVKKALIDHAFWQRDNPSINHKMESYLSSIHSLLIGYEFTKNESLLKEAVSRSENLKTDALPKDPKTYTNQKDFAAALEKASHLPPDPGGFGGEAIWKISNGLRVFGWTHAFNIPALVYWLERENQGKIKK